jgi:microsomal epoxide hydrolase
LEDEKRGEDFFQKILRKLKFQLASAIFPAEMSEWPPRSYVERIFNIKQME